MLTDDQHMENLDEFSKRLLDCIRSCGRGEKTQMQVRQAAYDKSQKVTFCSVQLCPTKKTSFAVDIPQAIAVFDKLDSCEVSNYQKTTEGIDKTPHVKTIGTFRGVLVMCDVFMTPTALGK